MEPKTVGDERTQELQKNDITGRCMECAGNRYRDETGACERCYKRAVKAEAEYRRVLREIEKLLAYDK